VRECREPATRASYRLATVEILLELFLADLAAFSKPERG
jgi:hypothetical protein